MSSDWRSSLHHHAVFSLWLDNILPLPQQTTKSVWRGSKAKCRSFYASNSLLGKCKKVQLSEAVILLIALQGVGGFGL